MVPLTVDDLLPLEEYARRRREFFDSHRRYIDRYRRIRIGPSLTLIFENRQTLWYRVQEVIRIARLAKRRDVEQELNLYNRLLPGTNLLQAALLIEIDESRFREEMSRWRDLSGEQLKLCVDDGSVPATLVTSRPEDRSIGTAHWVQFAVDPSQRRLLADFDLPGRFTFDNGWYQHASDQLSEDLRRSLLDDLALAEREVSPPLAA
jgi:hypothetical protein